MKRPVCIALAALLILAATSAPDAWGASSKRDIILLKDGTKKEVPSVTDENYANLVYRRGSSEDKIKIVLVKAVIYHDAPGDYHNGMGLFSSKRYSEAAQAFESALNASGVRPWIKQYALFHAAECYRKMGKTNTDHFQTAIEKYRELLSTVPVTKFLPEALFHIGECHTALKEYDEAVAAFRKLQTEVSTKALEQRWALEADLAEGKVLETKKDFMGAFHKYNSIHTTASRMGLHSVASKALLRKGICLIKQKKFSEAERYFKDLYRNAKGVSKEIREVKGGACIGLGSCYLQKKDYFQARFWFLSSMVKFFSSEEFHPQAMYYAGYCFHQIGGKEKGAKARAKAIMADLLRRYPASEWAGEARRLGYK